LNGGLDDVDTRTMRDDRQGLLKITTKNDGDATEQMQRGTYILKQTVHSFDSEPVWIQVNLLKRST